MPLPIYFTSALRSYRDSLKHITYMLLILYFFYLVILFFLFSHYNKIKRFLCREIKLEKMKTSLVSNSTQQGMSSRSLFLLKVKIFTKISRKNVQTIFNMITCLEEYEVWCGIRYGQVISKLVGQTIIICFSNYTIIL